MHTGTVVISYQRIAGWSPFFNNFICKVEAQVKFFYARISDLVDSKLIHFWIISFKVLIKKKRQLKTNDTSINTLSCCMCISVIVESEDIS